MPDIGHTVYFHRLHAPPSGRTAFTCDLRPMSWECGDGFISVGNYAYVCPTCLDVWARVVITRFPGATTDPIFEVCSQPCHRHPLSAYRIAGSLLLNAGPYIRDPHLLDSLPPELVQRELILTLNHKERFPDANT